MTLKAMLEEIAARTGVKASTLKTRWQRGLRGSDLEALKLPARRAKPQPIPTQVTKLPPLPVRVPQSLRYR